MGSRRSVALCAAVAVGLALGSGAGIVAAFSATAVNDGNVVTSAPDFTPPDIVAVAIGEGEGGATGSVVAGETYHVYADVLPDSGNPPSGTASVTADVSEVTAGSTSIPLTAGTYSAGGQSYNYRSDALTADDPLAEGEQGFTVTAVDHASNDETAPGIVTVVTGDP
jgi:hypothetical protein